MFALLLPSFCNYKTTALVALSQEPGLKKDDKNNLLNNFIKPNNNNFDCLTSNRIDMFGLFNMKPNKYVLTVKHETE